MKEISKYASMMYRCGQIYYDEQLEPYHIGCGQQFFLLRIHERPGISPYELAMEGFYDKGTTARAIKKLEELAYIRREMDEKDHRIQHLYLTEQGMPLIQIIKEMLSEWHEALMCDFNEEEKQLADALMKRLSENALAKIGRR